MPIVEEKQNDITFEQFSEEWLREFTEGEMSSFEKGRRFAHKLVTQWLGVNDDDPDLVLCDGSGDGGIDIAYLRRSNVDDASNEDDEQSEDDGDIWYLVQSKYGSSFQGHGTIINEGRKTISTIVGENNRISEVTKNLLERLNTFKQQASERDRIVLVFATHKAMSESDRQALDDLRTIGRKHIGILFDVEDVSLATIWEAREDPTPQPLSLPLKGNFVDPSSGLRVGTISLIDLYEFLKAYRSKTGNLDQIYEKNVRQFLGGRRKINKGIAATVQSEPELFGLYNNGITIVVSDFQVNEKNGTCTLYAPYIVNGCQTTKTIWEVLQQKLEAGGTGDSTEMHDWHTQAKRGVVVTKIVKGDSARIIDITRYTNSQNAVREQDFLALRRDFRSWSEEMADSYGIFLEIQRGGWDSQRAYQKYHPDSRQFKEHANAFDLIKIYAAGWLAEPGPAFGRNAPFLPGGVVFEKMVDEAPIGVNDLWAAYQLKLLADQFKFGRGSDVQLSRRQTRFLYYFVVMEILRDVLIKEGRNSSVQGVTNTFLTLLREENHEALQSLLQAGIQVVDEYMRQDSEYSLFKENAFDGDLNRWLKSKDLGKDGDKTYLFNSLLATHKHFFGRSISGQSSPRELVNQAISNP